MLIGVGKSKVVFKKLHLPMHGYGRLDHIAESIETDLHARAFAFRKGDITLAIINLECCFITHHLKKSVVEAILQAHPQSRLSMESLMLCSQHTHSAPGGYAHYAFFNLVSCGFRPDVFNAYKNACVDALSKALKDLEPSNLFLNADWMPDDSDVAFNRSLDAFNSNPENIDIDENHTQLAINRMMKQLRISIDEHTHKGLINWFGVQGTSISSKNSKIHPDNKGYAASLLENDKTEDRHFVAAFCGETQADVSPNYHGRAKWWPRGRYEDEFKSAYFSGFFQFEHARNLFESRDHQIPISGNLDFIQYYVDMSEVTCDPKFTPDNQEHETGAAVLGLSFLEGDDIDNPGIDSITATLIRGIDTYKNTIRKIPVLSSRKSRVRYKDLGSAHGPKQLVVELQEKRVLGYSNLNQIPLPGVMTDIGDEMKRQYDMGALAEHTWAPIIIPIQILILGEIAILAFPGEITTTAGNRLKQAVLTVLEKRGVIDVILTSNANEFSGYTTTFEEYQTQHYEAGFTLFGQYTLAAYQTVFTKMAEKLCEPIEKRHIPEAPQPPDFSKEELDKRTAR
jgi:neutral ceramidase